MKAILACLIVMMFLTGCSTTQNQSVARAIQNIGYSMMAQPTTKKTYIYPQSQWHRFGPNTIVMESE